MHKPARLLAVALFATVIFGLQGCKDASTSAERATQMDATVRGKLGPPPDSGTTPGQSGMDERAGGTSGTSEVSSRDAVVASGASWEVARTANPRGSFMLLRNVSDPSDATAVIRAAFGEDDVETLAPRQTSTWMCPPSTDEDVATVTLIVRTADGEVIHEADIRCGDAVYVGRRAPVQ